MDDLNTLTQDDISYIRSMLNWLHPPRGWSRGAIESKERIMKAIEQAQLCTGDVVIVGAASYRELEECLDAAAHHEPITGEHPRPYAYRLNDDGSREVHGPFDDLRALRDDMRGRGLTDEMIDVGYWPRARLAVVR